MRVLIAEDDPASRRVLEAWLRSWGYEVESVESGDEAVAVLERPDAPPLAILDWMMPGLDGPAVCQAIRAIRGGGVPYLIVLTVRQDRGDRLAAFRAGADDFLVKPFDGPELEARVGAGARVAAAELALADQVTELQAALAPLRRLQGPLPICAYCSRIRDDHDAWQALEAYLREVAGVRFSHGICPDCYEAALDPP